MLVKVILVCLFAFMCAVVEKRCGIRYKFSFWIMAILILLLLGGNYENADLKTYEYRYWQAGSQLHIGMQWAQNIVVFIAHKVGLSFEQFRFFYYLGAMSVIAYSCKIAVGYDYKFWVIYSIFPMVIDSTQMRNFMAMAFVTLALISLRNRSFKSNIFYFVYILVAAGFHTMAYAYLPLLFWIKGIKKRALQLTLGIGIVALGTSKQFRNIFSSVFLSLTQGELYDRVHKFFEKVVNHGYLVYILSTLIIFCLLRMIAAEMKKRNVKNSVIDIAYSCCTYSFVFIPLMFFAQDFSRIFRCFTLIYHFAVLIYHRDNKRLNMKSHQKFIGIVINRQELKIWSVYLFYLIYMFYWDISIYWESVVEPFWNSNYFF